MHALRLAVFSAVALLPMAAHAEFQISGYGGANTANNSDVTLKTPLVSGTYDVDWYGDSFHMPPYWGIRGTWWLTDFNRPRWGVAIDYTHAKVVASHLGVIPFSHLEFTDGLNTITLNGLYRMPLNNRLTAYVGAGAGAAFPHVEVKTIPYQGTTWGYQVTGPDFQGFLGVDINVAYGVSLFAEYKANYSINDADLVGGGSLKTNVLTHNFSVGVSISLGPRPQY